MLRVRLDACDVAGDRVWFDGVLLSGVGVEIVGPGVSGLRRGTVRLWEYVKGRRIGRWVEPDLGGSQEVIITPETLDQAQGDPDFEYGIEEFYTLDDEGFTGVVAVFDGPHLWGLESLNKGTAMSSRYVYWARDGTVDDYGNWYSHPYGEGAIRVLEEIVRGRVPWLNFVQRDGDVYVKLYLGAGHRELLPSGSFDSYPPGDPRRYYSSLVHDVDESGRLYELLHLGDESHFEVASQVGPLVPLRGDHLLSLADFAGLEVASSISIGVGDGLLTQILEALGGAAAFAGVTHLRLAPRDLSRGTVEWFAALPNLESIEHASMDPGLVEEVFGELRPDVVVTRGGRRVSGG